jgi:hypothetical protein
MKQIKIALLTLSLCTAVSAQEFTGQELRKGLIADETLVRDRSRATLDLLTEAQATMSFIRGVSDTYALLGNCMPANTSPGQKMNAVRKYMDEHPEQWQESAVVIVINAFKAKIVCPRKDAQ